jgi:hypothetical protein
MAQGVAWIGGSGDFTDDSDWSSDQDGNPAGSPATPPGAGMRAEYLVAGTVSFASSVSNGEADVNASMVFDLLGGGYSLTGIGGNQGLQFDVGAIGATPAELTVTGAHVLTTAGLNAANAANITITGGATIDVTGSGTTYLFSPVDVDVVATQATVDVSRARLTVGRMAGHDDDAIAVFLGAHDERLVVSVDDEPIADGKAAVGSSGFAGRRLGNVFYEGWLIESDGIGHLH